MIGSDIMVTPDRSWLHRIITRYALHKGDLFISTSASMTERLGLLCKQLGTRLLTQQYGVEDWVINYNELPKRYDFASNRAWVANSNILSVLESFALLPAGRTLALIGEGGPLSERIRNKADLTAGVECFGHLPYNDNVKIIAQSTFYLSFTDSDGASLSLMEAMALNCIPIVSDIKPNREWVTHGVNGYVIDPHDPVGTARIMTQALHMSDDEKRAMQRINRDIILQKGSFTKNMSRLNDRIARLASGISQ
jgi:glycosyltransferase involved in cell wall biosynthesis